MAINTLGTLTLDLIANLGGFLEPLSKAERAAKKAMDGIGGSVDSLGNYTDRATKELDKLASKMSESFNNIGSNLKREIALYGDTSRASKLRYDLEYGELSKMDDAQKKSIINMSARLDALDAADAALKKLTATSEQYNSMLLGMDKEIALFGAITREAQIRYETEIGSLSLLENAQKQSLILRAQEIDALNKVATAEKEASALKSTFMSSANNLEKEIALYGETSRAAKMRYDLEYGELSKLDNLQKRYLVDLSSQLDIQQKNAAMQAQFASLNSNLEKEIALYGELSRTVKLRYELENGQLKSLDAAQKASLLTMAQRLDAMDDANSAFMANKNAVNQTAGSWRNFRGVATGLGYQLQDTAVQLQMGTSAMVVFGQQGSQVASLFGPWGAIAGAVIAVAGALGGVFLKSLLDAGETADEVSARVENLIKKMQELDEEQKKTVRTAQGYRISDKQKEYDGVTKSIEDQIRAIEELNASQGKLVSGGTATFGVSGAGQSNPNTGAPQFAIDNTKFLAEEQRKLNDLQIQQTDLAKEIEALEDPFGYQERIKGLKEEIELIGLSSYALYKKQELQKGDDVDLSSQIAGLMLQKDVIEAVAKLTEETIKITAAANKKREEDEKKRLENYEKLLTSMRKEADLYGVTTRAAKLQYDIEKGIVDVRGGVGGKEGSALMESAKNLDMLDQQAKAQDEYVKKMEDWVKGEYSKQKSILDTIKALEAEAAALGQTADEYRMVSLMAAGATEAQASYIIELEKSNLAAKEAAKSMEQMWERIDGAAAGIWDDMFSGAKSSFDGIQDIFKKMLSEMAHEAITKPILINIKDSLQPWLDNLKKTLDSSKGSSGSGLGNFGVWGLIAAGIGAAFTSFNRKQDEVARKMSSDYRQSIQSLGTVLGESGKHSESIAKSTSNLSKYADDTLHVNYQMYRTLLDIREGISGVAAGFARQFQISGVGLSNSMEGSSIGFSRSSSLPDNETIKRIGDRSISLDPLGLFGGSDNAITEFVQGFMGGITDKISKALYSKKTKVIDSGIAISGQALADILEGGALGAFAYAEVQTKKKTLGITTSNKVKTQQEALDAVLLQQFGSIFESAGEALESVAPVFGKEFSDVLPRLIINASKLSLKDLEGDELTQEIEAFFSSTLDTWAGILAGGTGILDEFQRVGEGAFEAIIRLSSETMQFTEIAKSLDLSFNLSGVSAIKATQAIADAAGGFDALTQSLSNYYQEFYSEQERAGVQLDALTSRLSELGVDAVPKTREAFRALIDAQNLSTEAGQKQFAALIGLSGAVDQYIDSLEEEAKAREDAQKKIRDAVSAAFDTFSTVIQRDMAVIEKSLNSTRDLSGALSSALDSMRSDALDIDLGSRRAAISQVVTATAIAQAGGPLPTSESLADALNVLSTPSKGLYASFEEYQRDFYSAQRSLDGLKKVADDQITTDEAALEALQSSLDYYQQQVNLLNGIDTGIISLNEALSRLNAAFLNAGVILPNPVSISTPVGVQANQSFVEVVDTVKAFNEDLNNAMFAIAKYTQDTKKVLEKWDVDGMPEQRDYTT